MQTRALCPPAGDHEGRPYNPNGAVNSMPQISATVITHNEAPNMPRVLRSLACADEVVVVDSGSMDGTAEIAASLGARVVEHGWPGFAAQKNFAASQARFPWILSLDADEELNAEAQAALEQWKKTEPAAAGYSFRRRAYYLGHWIRHSGWYPDWKIRLYDRDHGEWKGRYVHESVAVTGQVEALAGEILHYTCDSLEDHQRRIEFYTDLAARELEETGGGVNSMRRALAPSWTFLNTYFFRLGILDGYPGFLISRMAARYVARKYQKWAELRAENRAH
ncbi:MAG TPA: glycosyltransferase family 2 protein [Terriglobia bacterium]|nr:glycosyltransferase family 2 protein [Terriglobia bacterium]